MIPPLHLQGPISFPFFLPTSTSFGERGSKLQSKYVVLGLNPSTSSMKALKVLQRIGSCECPDASSNIDQKDMLTGTMTSTKLAHSIMYPLRFSNDEHDFPGKDICVQACVCLRGGHCSQAQPALQRLSSHQHCTGNHCSNHDLPFRGQYSKHIFT
jgi:hypothetical protein